MKSNRFIAHHRKFDQTAQTVREHLEGVCGTCRDLAEKIGVPSAGELLGLLHDFGKYSKQFQTYIQSATGMLNPDVDDEYVDATSLRGRIDHSSSGAQWIWENFRRYGPQGELAGQILALCLASHHGGLIDCLKPGGENGFAARMRKDDAKTHLQECIGSIDSEVFKRLNLLATPNLIQNCSQQILKLVDPGKKQSDIVKHFNIGMWVRFLFSCLIDADRINSADFENPDNEKLRPQDRVNWPVAIDRLEIKLSNLPIRHAIDSIRRNISDQCKARASDPRGIYTLTVPTGGGKTYSSIRYALHHAQKHNLDRIIYIIPYTSIIEQNAQAVRDILEVEGDHFPWVLEHHSNLEPERQTWRDKLIAENWDAPIVFTTMVQFLDVLFSGGTRGARRMHQLANSILIFDEIQTLPINCVHLFCNAVNFLASPQVGTTVVLCTATQPLLDKLKSPDKGQLFIPKGNELVEDVVGLFGQLKRVTISNKVRPVGWTESELTELAVNEYEQKGSCLVVVNTKKWAQLLYESCQGKVEPGSIFHLSTSLCPAHRKVILDQVRQRLDDDLPVLCISTQLIEAGVDVDFASVIRFLAGLDSIAQAAGRCNRNGRLPQATVHVVNPWEEAIEMLHDIKEGRDKALRVLSEKDGTDLLDPEVMSLYFSYYFYSRADEMVYPIKASLAGRDDSLLSLLSDNSRNIGRVKNALKLQQSFKTAGKIFQAIDAPTEAVIVPYGEGVKIIAGLCAVPEPAEAYQLLKRAQKFSVNVFPNIMRKLKEAKAVRPVQQGEEIYYLDERHYSQDFGLSTEEVSTMKFQNA
ncbi:MAG: CRISPR-associated helicase Cas3' [Proteobacteria bacterium]|nr:CRISPR-associated helicase Cas3' [Pseudomonadota bacterium]MBU1711163.1 CRISPR-associated helicase Cas3' [Pseudomonadota bacterium]